MTGSAASFSKCELDVAPFLASGEKNWVRDLGEGGNLIGPGRGLADDGKRLGLSESALDVAWAIVTSS